MTSVLLDTNVVVSFLTDRDPAQQRDAAQLLEAAAARRVEVVVHQITATDLVYVLGNLYRREPAEVAALLRELLALPGLRTVDEMPWRRLFDLWPLRVPQFADAALAAVAAEFKLDAAATFDIGLRRRLMRLGLRSYW